MDACRSELESCDQEKDQKNESFRKFKKQKRSFVNLETLDDDLSQATTVDEFCTSNTSAKRDIQALYILERAFSKVTAIGSATAMIGILNRNKMSLCNLGDSGFQVYRQAHNTTYLAHRSKEQAHSFNIPY